MPRTVMLLHIGIFGCSLAGVCGKLAATQPFCSPRFLFFYTASLGILGAYALFWQQMLKRLPLTTAYACRGMSVVWAAGWGWLIFGESLTLKSACAAVLVLAGIRLAVSADG